MDGVDMILCMQKVYVGITTQMIQTTPSFLPSTERLQEFLLYIDHAVDFFYERKIGCFQGNVMDNTKEVSLEARMKAISIPMLTG